MGVPVSRNGCRGQLLYTDDEAIVLLLCDRHNSKESGHQSQGVCDDQGQCPWRPCVAYCLGPDTADCFKPIEEVALNVVLQLHNLIELSLALFH